MLTCSHFCLFPIALTQTRPREEKLPREKNHVCGSPHRILVSCFTTSVNVYSKVLLGDLLYQRKQQWDSVQTVWMCWCGTNRLPIASGYWFKESLQTKTKLDMIFQLEKLIIYIISLTFTNILTTLSISIVQCKVIDMTCHVQSVCVTMCVCVCVWWCVCDDVFVLWSAVVDEGTSLAIRT